jgi:hypothetical protein
MATTKCGPRTSYPIYLSFGRDYQAGAIEALYMISPDTPQQRRVPVRSPKSIFSEMDLFNFGAIAIVVVLLITVV